MVKVIRGIRIVKTRTRQAEDTRARLEQRLAKAAQKLERFSARLEEATQQQAAINRLLDQDKARAVWDGQGLQVQIRLSYESRFGGQPFQQRLGRTASFEPVLVAPDINWPQMLATAALRLDSVIEESSGREGVIKILKIMVGKPAPKRARPYILWVGQVSGLQAFRPGTRQETTYYRETNPYRLDDFDDGQRSITREVPTQRPCLTSGNLVAIQAKQLRGRSFSFRGAATTLRRLSFAEAICYAMQVSEEVQASYSERWNEQRECVSDRDPYAGVFLIGERVPAGLMPRKWYVRDAEIFYLGLSLRQTIAARTFGPKAKSFAPTIVVFSEQGTRLADRFPVCFRT